MKKCDLCKSGTLEFKFKHPRDAHLDIIRCTSCKSEFLSPVPTDDELKKIYTANYYKAWGMETNETSAVREMKKNTFRRRFRESRRYTESIKRVLDIGTASGFLLEVAREFGSEPYGIELSEYSSAIAKRKFGDNHIHTGTIETCDFEKRSFDLIFMSDLIEHVTNPVLTLNHAEKFLRPGGYLIIVTPEIGSPSSKLMRHLWTHYKTEHLTLFSRLGLTEAAKAAHLDTIDIFRATKSLTISYISDQFRVYPTPIIGSLAHLLNRLPKTLRERDFTFSIGEMVAVLRKPL